MQALEFRWNTLVQGCRMPRRNGRDFGRVFRRRIAAPDHAHVGADEHEIIAIDLARGPVRQIERLDRRAMRGNGALKAARVMLRLFDFLLWGLSGFGVTRGAIESEALIAKPT
jgi:hypothetical protein